MPRKQVPLELFGWRALGRCFDTFTLSENTRRATVIFVYFKNNFYARKERFDIWHETNCANCRDVTGAFWHSDYMKPAALEVLHSFINTFSVAWAAFVSVSPNTILADFAFVQDRGSFVLTDDKGGSHVFRLWREEIVALISPNGQFAFVDGEKVIL